MRKSSCVNTLSTSLVLLVGISMSGAVPAKAASNLICNGCVGKTDIADNAVTSGKIRNGTVRAKDLHRSAKPPGMAASSGNQHVVLVDSADRVIRELHMKVPTNGMISVMASWTFNGLDSAGRCSLTKGKVINYSHLTVAEMAGETNFVPGSAVRAYEVEKGSHQFNLVCDKTSGTPTIQDSSIVGHFFPVSYQADP